RIKLSNTFGQSLFNQDSSTALKSDSAFKAFFKGFAVIPDETFGGNTITYYNLTDSNTKLAVYFKYNPATTKDTGVYYFRYTDLSKSANYVSRNHGAPAEIAQFNVPVHPPAGDSVIY